MLRRLLQPSRQWREFVSSGVLLHRDGVLASGLRDHVVVHVH
jgi:hypothetical protein